MALALQIPTQNIQVSAQVFQDRFQFTAQCKKYDLKCRLWEKTIETSQ